MKQLLLILFFGLILCVVRTTESNAKIPAILSAKDKALDVLVRKCNDCHRKDKPNIIFNKSNMNRYARRINRQVFILNNMPKGTEYSLTSKERVALKTWLRIELKKN